MIVDTSALIAIIQGERHAEACLEAVRTADSCGMSAASFHEACVVVDRRRNAIASRTLDPLRRELGIHLVPFTATQGELARDAYRDFGKHSGSAAKLNLADCYAYALATELGEPLLFVGNDFIHTDLTSALEDPRP